MAITLNVDNRLREEVDRNVDRSNLKLRLALEGVEIESPVYGSIRVRHPQFGETHFDSWGTLESHYNENWKTTFWGNKYTQGGSHAAVHTDSGSGGVSIPHPV